MNSNKIEVSGKQLLTTIVLVLAIWAILYYGSNLIMPLVVSAMIATLLDKPTKKFKKWGFPRWLAISVSMVLMIIFLFLLSWLISSQISNIADDWPTIKEKAMNKYGHFSIWVQQTFNIDPRSFVNNNFNFIDAMKKLFKAFLSSVSNLASQSFIVLIYIILFLVQKQIFIGFFKKLVNNKDAAADILKNSSRIISDYLFGKGKLMVFLMVIYYAGFAIGQVPFALFLALFVTLFSIIPYVGNIIGGGAAVILAFLYSGSTSALIVIGVIAAAQLIENYILTPWIVGDEIDLNPFITVFGIILFSALWGMVGAIIALPILGVLKVLLEYTNGMEAYAYLLKQHKK